MGKRNFNNQKTTLLYTGNPALLLTEATPLNSALLPNSQSRAAMLAISPKRLEFPATRIGHKSMKAFTITNRSGFSIYYMLELADGSGMCIENIDNINEIAKHGR